MHNLRVHIYLLVLVVATPLIFFSCSKGEDSVRFKEVVSCKVNGVEWKNCCENCGGIFGARDPLDCAFSPSSEFVELVAGNDCGGALQLMLLVTRSSLSNQNELIYIGREFNDWNNRCDPGFDLDTSEINYLRVEEFNVQELTISGTFGFSAENSCGHRVVVTDGVFSVYYHRP